jgi:hypothetical protein
MYSKEYASSMFTNVFEDENALKFYNICVLNFFPPMGPLNFPTKILRVINTPGPVKDSGGKG